MGRQSGASNAGLARLREARVRRDDKGGIGISYNNLGEQKDVPGDDQGPFVKSMPFPSTPSLWLEATFDAGLTDSEDGVVPAGEYSFLTPLEIGHVRTITTWFEFVGLSDDSDGSVLSVVPGSVLPGIDVPEFVAQTDGSVPNETATREFAAQFYPFGVVDLSPTAVNYAQNLGTGPAVSREMMPSEFRTAVIAPGGDEASRTVRFNLEWDVAPFERFTLAVTDLTENQSEGNRSTLKVYYSYSL